MPEPANREERERELAEILFMSWILWSDVLDYRSLSRDGLRAQLNQSRDLVRDIWMGGYLSVMNQFGGRRVGRQEDGFFDAFYRDLSTSLATRWMRRVDLYDEDQRSVEPYRSRWVHVRGRGQRVARRVPGLDTSHRIITPGQTEYGPTGMEQGDFTEYYDPDTGLWYWISDRVAPDDPRRTIGARPVVFPSDADRESVNWVTGSNMFGEFFGVRQVESQGLGTLEGIWNTQQDERTCPVCSPLHGRPRRIWRRVAPNGSPVHNNCRCWITWANRIFTYDG